MAGRIDSRDAVLSREADSLVRDTIQALFVRWSAPVTEPVLDASQQPEALHYLCRLTGNSVDALAAAISVHRTTLTKVMHQSPTATYSRSLTPETLERLSKYAKLHRLDRLSEAFRLMAYKQRQAVKRRGGRS